MKFNTDEHPNEEELEMELARSKASLEHAKWEVDHYNKAIVELEELVQLVKSVHENKATNPISH